MEIYTGDVYSYEDAEIVPTSLDGSYDLGELAKEYSGFAKQIAKEKKEKPISTRILWESFDQNILRSDRDEAYQYVQAILDTFDTPLSEESGDEDTDIVVEGTAIDGLNFSMLDKEAVAYIIGEIFKQFAMIDTIDAIELLNNMNNQFKAKIQTVLANHMYCKHLEGEERTTAYLQLALMCRIVFGAFSLLHAEYIDESTLTQESMITLVYSRKIIPYIQKLSELHDKCKALQSIAEINIQTIKQLLSSLNQTILSTLSSIRNQNADPLVEMSTSVRVIDNLRVILYYKVIHKLSNQDIVDKMTPLVFVKYVNSTSVPLHSSRITNILQNIRTILNDYVSVAVLKFTGSRLEQLYSDMCKIIVALDPQVLSIEDHSTTFRSKPYTHFCTMFGENLVLPHMVQSFVKPLDLRDNISATNTAAAVQSQRQVQHNNCYIYFICEGAKQPYRVELIKRVVTIDNSEQLSDAPTIDVVQCDCDANVSIDGFNTEIRIIDNAMPVDSLDTVEFGQKNKENLKRGLVYMCPARCKCGKYHILSSHDSLLVYKVGMQYARNMTESLKETFDGYGKLSVQHYIDAIDTILGGVGDNPTGLTEGFTFESIIQHEHVEYSTTTYDFSNMRELSTAFLARMQGFQKTVNFTDDSPTSFENGKISSTLHDEYAKKYRMLQYWYLNINAGTKYTDKKLIDSVAKIFYEMEDFEHAVYEYERKLQSTMQLTYAKNIFNEAFSYYSLDMRDNFVPEAEAISQADVEILATGIMSIYKSLGIPDAEFDDNNLKQIMLQWLNIARPGITWDETVVQLVGLLRSSIVSGTTGALWENIRFDTQLVLTEALQYGITHYVSPNIDTVPIPKLKMSDYNTCISVSYDERENILQPLEENVRTAFLVGLGYTKLQDTSVIYGNESIVFHRVTLPDDFDNSFLINTCIEYYKMHVADQNLPIHDLQGYLEYELAEHFIIQDTLTLDRTVKDQLYKPYSTEQYTMHDSLPPGLSEHELYERLNNLINAVSSIVQQKLNYTYNLQAFRLFCLQVGKKELLDFVTSNMNYYVNTMLSVISWDLNKPWVLKGSVGRLYDEIEFNPDMLQRNQGEARMEYANGIACSKVSNKRIAEFNKQYNLTDGWYNFAVESPTINQKYYGSYKSILGTEVPLWFITNELKSTMAQFDLTNVNTRTAIAYAGALGKSTDMEYMSLDHLNDELKDCLKEAEDSSLETERTIRHTLYSDSIQHCLGKFDSQFDLVSFDILFKKVFKMAPTQLKLNWDLLTIREYTIGQQDKFEQVTELCNLLHTSEKESFAIQNCAYGDLISVNSVEYTILQKLACKLYLANTGYIPVVGTILSNLRKALQKRIMK